MTTENEQEVQNNVDEQNSETQDDAGKDSKENKDNKDNKQVGDDAAKLLKEVMKQKEKMKALQAELDKYKDIDLEQAKKALSDLENQEKQKLEAKGEFDKLKKMMAEAHEKEKTSLLDEITKLKEGSSHLSSQIEKLTIGVSFGNSKYIRDNLVLTPNKAQALYASYFDIVDGEVKSYDKPRGSEDRTEIVDSSGKSLPFDLALEKIINSDPDKDTLLKSKVPQGAGSKPNNTKVEQKQDKTNLSGVERISLALQTKKL